MATMYPPQNNSPYARLVSSIGSGETSFSVDDGSILPAAPNVLTLGVGEDAELVLMTYKSGNILTVTRGYNSTTAGSWPDGTAVYRAITAQDISALQENVDAKQATITASGILKGNGSGGISAATAGTDYQTPITASGILKGSGGGVISAATAGSDYQAAITVTGILKGSGGGSVSKAVAGVDYNRYATGTAINTFPAAVSGVTTLANGQKYAFSFNSSSRKLKGPVNGYCSGTMSITGSSSGSLTFDEGEVVIGETFPLSGPQLYAFDVQNGVWHFAKAVQY